MRKLILILALAILPLSLRAATPSYERQTADLSTGADVSQWSYVLKQGMNGYELPIDFIAGYTNGVAVELDLSGYTIQLAMRKPTGVEAARITGVNYGTYGTFTCTSNFLSSPVDNWSLILVATSGSTVVNQASGNITIKPSPELDSGDLVMTRSINISSYTWFGQFSTSNIPSLTNLYATISEPIAAAHIIDATAAHAASAISTTGTYANVQAAVNAITAVTATTNSLGLIIVGDNLTVDGNGRVSASAPSAAAWGEITDIPAAITNYAANMDQGVATTSEVTFASVAGDGAGVTNVDATTLDGYTYDEIIGEATRILTYYVWGGSNGPITSTKLASLSSSALESAYTNTAPSVTNGMLIGSYSIANAELPSTLSEGIMHGYANLARTGNVQERTVRAVVRVVESNQTTVVASYTNVSTIVFPQLLSEVAFDIPIAPAIDLDGGLDRLLRVDFYALSGWSGSEDIQSLSQDGYLTRFEFPASPIGVFALDSDLTDHIAQTGTSVHGLGTAATNAASAFATAAQGALADSAVQTETDQIWAAVSNNTPRLDAYNVFVNSNRWTDSIDVTVEILNGSQGIYSTVVAGYDSGRFLNTGGTQKTVLLGTDTYAIDATGDSLFTGMVNITGTGTNGTQGMNFNAVSNAIASNPQGFLTAEAQTLQDVVTLGGTVTSGVVTIDAANARTNTYGGLRSVLGIAVQSGIDTIATGNNGATAMGYNAVADGNDGATALGYYTTASGAFGATALGYYASALGNNGATALGYYTAATGNNGATALGYNATATHDSSFVWSDGTSTASTDTNQFTVYASNGIRLLGGAVSGNLSGGTSLPLSGIAQSGATSGQVPTWNGSAYAPATPSAGGGGSGFPLTNDVSLAGYSMTNGTFGAVGDTGRFDRCYLNLVDYLYTDGTNLLWSDN